MKLGAFGQVSGHAVPRHVRAAASSNGVPAPHAPLPHPQQPPQPSAATPQRNGSQDAGLAAPVALPTAAPLPAVALGLTATGGLDAGADAARDLSQRLLMEQMAVLQRQLMDMASLVATTQAQNQALLGQVSVLSQQVAQLSTSAAQPAGPPLQQPPQQTAAPPVAQQEPASATLPAPVPGSNPVPVVQASAPAAPSAAESAAVAAPAEARAPTAEPQPAPAASPTGPETDAAQAQVHQLSVAAQELQSLFAELAAKTGGPVAPAPAQQQQSRPAARVPQRQEEQRGKGAQAVEKVDAASFSPAAVQPRAAGRGGRYVGPPREQPFPPRQAVTQQPTPAAPTDCAAVTAPQEATDAPGVATATAADSAAGAPEEGSVAAMAALPVMEARIRGCRTALELKALLEAPGGRLSPADAVLAAQQLPRFARQWQQQQTQGAQTAPAAAALVGKGGTASGKRSADPEAAAIEELLGRLLSRFTTPAALQGLRRAFLPSYLSLQAVSAQLRVAPSRAFAGAVRQLVTEHAADLDPAAAAAGVAAVVALDGTVAPGVLARACKVLTDSAAALAAAQAAPEAAAAEGADAAVTSPPQGPKRALLSGRALVAAGQVAGLGPAAAEAARQVLAAAGAAAAARPSPPRALCEAEALTSAAAGALACVAAGVQVPATLLKQMETASLIVSDNNSTRSDADRDRGADGGRAKQGGVLSDMGAEGQLQLARAFVETGHQPEERWLRAWERAVVASGLPAAAPPQVAALAAALHALSRSPAPPAPVSADQGAVAVIPRPRFVAAAAERLRSAPGSGVSQAGNAAALCALALHLGELSSPAASSSSTSTSSAAANPRFQADVARAQAASTAVGEALLAAVTAPGALASLDAPDLAALAAGLGLLQLRLPAEVWSAALSRATDAAPLAAALTGAARRGMELGLPAGIKPPAFDHFLSMVGQHVPGLGAPELVGLMGLATAVRGSLRPALAASALTRLAATAAALAPADAAFLLATVDALGLNLAAPLAARPMAVAGAEAAGVAAAEHALEALTPAAVLRRVADSGALEPKRVVADLGLERCAALVELVARLQQAADVAEAEAQAEAAAALAPAVAADEASQGGAGAGGKAAKAQPTQAAQSKRLVARRQLVELLELLRPALVSASPAALVALVSGAAALELSLSPAWLGAFVAAARAALPDLDPLTASRIAVALTRCEQLAGRAAHGTATAPGGDGASADGVRDAVAQWVGEYVADQQRKLAAAPPAALALTVQVVAARSLRLPEGWLASFMAACTPSLEAPLPLTQAQAAGAAAAAAAVASSRGKPATPRPAATTATGAAPAAALAAAAASFTPSQLATLLRCLADLQQQSQAQAHQPGSKPHQQQPVVPAAWLALAARQVEGRLVHFSFPDLAEALYGMLRLGGSVREGAANQLIILSQGGGKLAAAPPALLAHTLAAVAAAEGRKVSPRWWEELQRVAAAQLLRGDAAPTTATPDLLASVVTSLLKLRRDKAGADLSEQLSAAMAAALCGEPAGPQAGASVTTALAAALPAEAAAMYVEAAARDPRGLGQRVPPPALLQTYLQHSDTVLGALAASAVAAADANSEDEAATASSSAPAPAGTLSKTGGRDAKRARGRGAKRADKRASAGAQSRGSGSGLLPAHLVEHLSSALAVGRLLVALPSAQQPAAAGPWLQSLVAAGAAAADCLEVTDAAEVLWLVATISRSGLGRDGTDVVASPQQVAALAARVNGDAPGAAGRLSADAAVDAVWALRVLKLMPSTKLLVDASRGLPRRLAARSLSPGDVHLLVSALTAGGDDVEASIAAADAAAAAPVAAPHSSFTAELGRWLQSQLLLPTGADGSDADSALTTTQLAELVDAASMLGLGLQRDCPDALAAAAGRLAAAAASGDLKGDALVSALTGLQKLGHTPAPEVLDALCEAVADGAADGTLRGLFSLAAAAAGLYDMGARPGTEWLAGLGEAVVGAIDSEERLAPRAAVWALETLASRFDGNFMVLALAATQALTQDLQEQLAAAGDPGYQGAGAAADTGATGAPSPHVAAREAALAKAAQAADVGDEGVAEAQVGAALFLWQPTDLDTVLQLLRALSAARQPVPEALWRLVEEAVRPALRRLGPGGAAAVAVKEQDEGGAGGMLLGGVSEPQLAALLGAMGRLDHSPSRAFLEDVERAVTPRMTVQSPELLAPLAEQCVRLSYIPSQAFTRALLKRLDDLMSRGGVSTAHAILLVRFLSTLVVASFQGDAEHVAQRARYLALMQSLVRCTRGDALLALSEEQGPELAAQLVSVMLVICSSFQISLPLSRPAGVPVESPAAAAARAEWAAAVQALTLAEMGSPALSWGHAGWLLQQLAEAEDTHVRVQAEWLSAYYKGLEAAATSLAPAELGLAAAALAAGKRGFQPHLAPTLPARLGAVLEDRIREFAQLPGVLTRLLLALGGMGHTLRTEVLQAVEALLYPPLEGAVECLQQARVLAEQQRKAAAAGGQGAASPERLQEVAEAAEAAVDMISSEKIFTLTQALRAQAFRPGPKLTDALMGACRLLSDNTTVDLAAQDFKKPPAAGSSPLLAPHWRSLTHVTAVMAALSEWGVTPTPTWTASAAEAVAVVCNLHTPEAVRQAEEQPDRDLQGMVTSLALLEGWGARISGDQVTMLAAGLHARMELWQMAELPFTPQLVALLDQGLARLHGGGSFIPQEALGAYADMFGVGEAEGAAATATAAASGTGGAFGGADAPRVAVRPPPRGATGGAGFGGAGRRGDTGTAAAAAPQPAEYRDLRPGAEVLEVEAADAAGSSPGMAIDSALDDLLAGVAPPASAATAASPAAAATASSSAGIEGVAADVAAAFAASASSGGGASQASTSASGAGAAPSPPVDVPSTRGPSFRRRTPPMQPPAGMSLDGRLGRAAVDQLLQMVSTPAASPGPAAPEASPSGADGAAGAAATTSTTRAATAAGAWARSQARAARAAAAAAPAAGGPARTPATGAAGAMRPAGAVTPPAAQGGGLNPEDPRTWNLLDSELQGLSDPSSGGGLEVVEPQVLEP
ncbi:hypothetical protein HYH02_010130 [Chlamydomonas schloesseri]|uniref:Uncharacterized protein n=1 Tax=Chlamydomonas schloesseri TaxID=2026947 RepID=A0A835W8Z1_9CHLO|nr:hypothetical protein HYH02_010130 [Chlamydomonas schloesseri]|eukprot:KAG2440546.1 hypothetical protein HYH02_010130 [Chlamydomonas schloesseri]